TLMFGLYSSRKCASRRASIMAAFMLICPPRSSFSQSKSNFSVGLYSLNSSLCLTTSLLPPFIVQPLPIVQAVVSSPDKSDSSPVHTSLQHLYRFRAWAKSLLRYFRLFQKAL